MEKHIFNILISLALLMSVCKTADAQPVRPQSSSENMVLSAVERYNDRDLEASEALLAAVLANDETNDAAWYYLSMIAVEKKEMADAEEFLRKACELDPDNYWYRYRLARLYAVTQRQELTISMYEELFEDFPKKSDLYFDMVELYAAQGEYEKALDTLKEIETVFGMTEGIAMYRFNLLRTLERHEEAYESLEEYNRQYSSPYVLSTLADYQMSMYNDSTALAYYDEALDIAPDYSPALLGKAETLRMTRKYDRYFDVLEKYVRTSDSPSSAKSDYLMAIVQRTDPKFVRSFMPQLDSVMAVALEVHPADSSILQTAGIYYYSTDRKDKARDHFRLNAETYPESLSASANLVEFLMFAEEWEALSEEGRKAYDRFPEETGFLEMASVGDYNLKEYGNVLDICEKVLEVAPDDSSRTLRAWSTMGDIYHQLGEDKKAYKAYDKALKINPDYVYVLNNYAYYLSLEDRDLEKALKMSSITVEKEPKNVTFIDTYAWVLYKMGRYKDAKNWMEKVFSYDKNAQGINYEHYGDILYKLGDTKKAVQNWKKAKKIGGTSEFIDQKIKDEMIYE